MVREQLPEYGGSVNGTCAAVAARPGLSKETVRGWGQQAQVDGDARAGMTTEEHTGEVAAATDLSAESLRAMARRRSA